VLLLTIQVFCTVPLRRWVFADVLEDHISICKVKQSDILFLG
jgi:hypothetical protein